MYDQEVEKYAQDLEFIYRLCEVCVQRVDAELTSQHRQLGIPKLLEEHAQQHQSREEEEEESEDSLCHQVIGRDQLETSK